MKQSIQKVALIVSTGTFLSKSAGLVRQLVIAGAFGVGAAYDAYNYAYILPGFCLVLLGGVNGPFHNSIVAVLSRKNNKESALILSSIQTITSALLIIVSLILLIKAELIIKLIAPGLTIDVHKLAVMQLRIMSPIALFSGLIGISFGALNAKEEFLIPSISPIFSSLLIILFISFFWKIKVDSIFSKESIIAGGILLATATSIGAFIQWIIQIPILIKKKLFSFKLIFNLNNRGVKEVLNILLPATLSAGMLQINVFTDLFFASNIAGAAAGLGYASFVIQAPLGIISNALIIPFLPSLSILASRSDKKELIKRVQQIIMMSSISMFCLGAILVALSTEIITLIYGRGAFNINAIKLVSNLLIAYGIGMPFYLGRDILVRVFYSMGDAKTPFRLSTIGIVLNIILDWLFIGSPSPWGNIFSLNLGASGLIFATVVINAMTCIFLLLKINRKLGGIQIHLIAFNNLKLLISACCSGLIVWFIAKQSFIESQFISLLIELTILTITSFSIFYLIGNYLKIKEIDQMKNVIREKLIHLF